MKKLFTLILLASFINSVAVFAIEDTPQKSRFFKRDKNEIKFKKEKRTQTTEIILPVVMSFKRPAHNIKVLSIEECVSYALTHNPSLIVSKDRIVAAKSSIGQQRSNYAPRLTARVNYNHNENNSTGVSHYQDNSLGFNVGISEMIWDFGRTTARINMAKYDTLSAEYDYAYELLDIIYTVKTNYYRVLSALANLDIYEQNVRIQNLNFERTKAMFDEGLKSKIDVVNAEVNLADAKIQLVEGQNTLAKNFLALKNSMYYQESDGFIVKNTENFGFLKADYRKKMQGLDEIKSVSNAVKRNEDGLIMLTSGIEHNDIIQDYEFQPMKISMQESVDKALDNRPDLKSIRMIQKVQEESLKAIKRQYAPELTADLNWGYTKKESMYSSPLQFGAGLGIGSINPYSIHYQIKEGESYLDIAKQNVNISKSDIYWEVQQNYVNMRQLERKIPLMHQKVKATLENFELADGRYSVGLNNYVELQDALTNYNKTQLSFVEAVFEYNVARETLLRSLGDNVNDVAVLEDK